MGGRVGGGRVVAGAVATLVALSAASCSGSVGDETLTVFAAASLTDVMAQLTIAFEEAEPGVDVDVSAGPSSALRESILAAAPADVFASADVTNMEALVEADAVASFAIFASNRPTIATPPENPAGVTGLADFGRAELLLGLCAPQVPCGAVALAAFEAAGIDPAPDTEAADVRALLTQISSGDLDAGIVYRTDVLAASGGVDEVVTDELSNVRIEYPIAVLDRSPRTTLAEAFVAFVRSPAGQEILAAAGFGAP